MALPTIGLFKIYQTKLYPILDEYLNFMFRVCMVLMPKNISRISQIYTLLCY